jgi:tetratricopeptide (TPR) repeat protein
LENDSRFEEAAGEYAAVPASHRCAQDAVLGRIRSWRRALEEASARGSFDEADRAALAERARNAVASIGEQLSATCTSRPASRPSDCAGMSTLLAFAELLNHPAIGGAEQTASLIAQSEAAFRSCPELLGPALRQKIVALRQLKRLTEARAVVDQYLAADPEHAGGAMAGLLQSMHDEVSNLLELGDLSSAAMVAAEAVQVGQSLLTWGDAKPERLRSSDRLVIRLWHASALLRAGESATALHAFEEIERQAQASLPENSATRILLQLGKADALLAVGRHTDALAAYASIWQACPEHSPEWWHAFVGNLRCHSRLDAVPDQVLASIKQQRFLSPDLGGKRWQRELLQIEQELSARAASQPQR